MEGPSAIADPSAMNGHTFRRDTSAKPCPQCNSPSLSDITGHGYVFEINVKKALHEAEEPDGNINECYLCSLVWWSLKNRTAKIQAMDEPVLALYCNPPFQGPIQQIDVIVVNERKREDLGWAFDGAGLWLLGPPDSKPWVTRGRIVLHAGHQLVQPDISKRPLKFRRIETNSASPACFDLAKQWISDCLSNHSKTCPSNKSSLLPIRLVDVGSGSEPPRLITTAPGQRGKYIALSYCWGRKPFFALTPANKSELETGIPFDRLSQTISDAIVVTRNLGVRYVWIDSLCIIQGEDEEAVRDWEVHAQHMGTIFRDALVTIAASSCGDAHQGLLCDRDSLSRSYYEFPADGEGNDVVYLGRYGDATGASAVNEPLHRRAWVFQESFLCVRSISYEKRELSWRCRACQCREGLVESEPLPESTSDRDVPSNIRANWKSIVAEYSAKSLTYSSDRLPAIAGLAEIAQNGSSTNYLCGIWMDQVAGSLLWQHLGHTNPEGVRVHTRQARHRAPSWSWASVDGKVAFLEGADPSYLHVKQVKGEGLLAKAYIRRVETIRLETSASYYGGYENFRPWTSLPTEMKTYLDSIEGVPTKHRARRDENSPAELVDVWFLYLGPSSGLILVETCNVESPSRTMLYSAYLSLVEDKRFSRIGAFVGYPIGRKGSCRILLV